MRIDNLVFGYRSLHINEEERANAATALLKRNLSAKIERSGYINVSLLRLSRYKKALKNVKYELSDIRGLPAYFIKYRKRYGIIFGFLLSFIYIILASSIVWNVKIDGNETISKAEIEEELSACGFEQGSFWMSKNLDKIEAELLSSSSRVGWININRRGSVAYVTVREKSVYEEQNNSGGFSNIVAKVDCVIEEITVRQGIACVKAGDTVKAGELIISGVIPAELGGGFVRADGDIYGAVKERNEVSVPQKEVRNVYGKMCIYEADIKIFNFSVKLFKKYRKNAKDCVIIDDEKDFVIFGKYRLPFGIRRLYAADLSRETVNYSEKEMIEIARARLAEQGALSLRGADVLRLSTSGYFTDNGYTAYTDLTVLRSIGEEKVFSDGKHE